MDSMLRYSDATEPSPEYVAWLRSGIEALEARRRRIEAQRALATSEAADADA